MATQSADELGGLLFRKVAPGKKLPRPAGLLGEESGLLTVHKQTPAPWDRSIFRQPIAKSGYQYLTTRDGTQLAIDVHPPTNPADEARRPSIRR